MSRGAAPQPFLHCGPADLGNVPHEAPWHIAGRDRVGVDGRIPVGQADVPVVQNEVGVIVLQLLLVLGNKQRESAA